jgi:hypothetical protein
VRGHYPRVRGHRPRRRQAGRGRRRGRPAGARGRGRGPPARTGPRPPRGDLSGQTRNRRVCSARTAYAAGSSG